MSSPIAKPSSSGKEIADYRQIAAERHRKHVLKQNPTAAGPHAAARVAVPEKQNALAAERVSAVASPTVVAVEVDGKHIEDKQYIYILRCKNNKYYVGKTRNVERRFLQHVTNDPEATSGASWTQLHEPLEIEKSFEMKSPHDEDTTTMDMMIEKGMDNVRGGTYCAIDLPAHQQLALRHQIAALKGVCYRCGLAGHFAKDCPGDQGEILIDHHAKRRRSVASSKKCACARCGRSNHTYDHCFAKTDKQGNIL